MAAATTKANNKLIEIIVEKEGSFFEKMAVLNSLLREELRDLTEDKKEFKKRLKTRGQQIITQVLGLGATGWPPTPRKARISAPSQEEIRALPPEFLLFLPSSLLPEDLRPVPSKSYTRKKSPSGSDSGSGLGQPEWIKQPGVQGVHENADRKLKEAFGPDVTKTAPFIGVVCDPIGFQQHSGECATDVLQQILLFADHWKAKTQPMVYNMKTKTFNEMYDRMLISSRFPSKVLYEFFRILQMRFRLHYAVIGMTKYAVNDECVEPFPYRKYVKALTENGEGGLVGALATRKRRLSTNLGVGAKNSIKRFLPGGSTSTEEMASYFKSIWAFCGLHGYYSFVRTRHAPPSTYPQLFPNYNHIAFYLGSDKVIPQTYRGIGRSESAGHATAMYMCDGKWVYYDDNQGVQDIAPALMDDILNEVDPFYIFWARAPGTNAILFFKAPFFTDERGGRAIDWKENEEEHLMAENDGDWSSRILYQWVKGGWKKIEYGALVDLATESYIYVFKRIIHITTFNKSVPGYPGTHFIDDQGSVVALAAAAATAAPFSLNAFYEKYPSLKPRPDPTPPVPVPVPVPVPNNVGGPRKALENALANARSIGRKRVNNTTRALEKRIKALGLHRKKNVNNTTRALKRRILELASGSLRR